MGDLTFGKSFDGLALQRFHWSIRSIHVHEKATGLLRPAPWITHLLSKLPSSLIPMAALLRFSEESLEARRQNSPPQPDILSHLLEADPFFADPEKERGLMTGDARLLIIAGSETTASTLTFLVYHLARDPSLQSTLFKELVAHKIQDSTAITVDAVRDLPYLNALVKEALRLHPPAPSGIARDTPPEGLQMGDVFIPGNITVTTPLYSIHRSEKAFVDPDDFIAERWTTRPELILHKTAFALFLIGPFACIGKQLAYNEMRTVAAMLVLTFKMRLADGEDGRALLSDSLDVFTMSVAPLQVVFERRTGKDS